MNNTSAAQRLNDLRADLMIEVVTQKQGGDVMRGFRAIDMLVEACAKLGGALLPGATATLRPLVVLEDCEANSVIAWQRLELRPDSSIADDAVNYVLGGIVESAKWLSNYGPGAHFEWLLRNLEMLPAKNANLYQPESARLLRAVCALEKARAVLAAGDRIFIVTGTGGVSLDNLSPVPEGHLLRSAATWQVKNEAIEMLLVVRAPDYSGGSLWRVQYDGGIVDVDIDDHEWLAAFANRTLDVREGDVLRAVGMKSQYYAADGEPLHTEIRLSTIRETITREDDPATGAITSRAVAADKTSSFAHPHASQINLSNSSRTTVAKQQGLRHHRHNRG